MTILMLTLSLRKIRLVFAQAIQLWVIFLYCMHKQKLQNLRKYFSLFIYGFSQSKPVTSTENILGSFLICTRNKSMLSIKGRTLFHYLKFFDTQDKWKYPLYGLLYPEKNLKSFLCDKSCNCITFEFQYGDKHYIWNSLFMLSELLYADGTIVFSTDKNELKII